MTYKGGEPMTNSSFQLNVRVDGVNFLKVVLNLPREKSREAIQVSQALPGECPVDFVLGEYSNFPHVTLGLFALPVKKMDLVHRKVEAIAKECSGVTCLPTGVKRNQGFLAVGMERGGILPLHERVICELAQFRDEARCSEYYVSEQLNSEQQQQIVQWGYPHARHLYGPRITLTRFQELDHAVSAASKLVWPRSPFVAESIGLYLAGNHGTCQMKIGEYPLAG